MTTAGRNRVKSWVRLIIMSYFIHCFLKPNFLFINYNRNVLSFYPAVNQILLVTKGQLISKCIFGVIVWTKIAK